MVLVLHIGVSKLRDIAGGIRMERNGTTFRAECLQQGVQIRRRLGTGDHDVVNGRVRFKFSVVKARWDSVARTSVKFVLTQLVRQGRSAEQPTDVLVRGLGDIPTSLRCHLFVADGAGFERLRPIVPQIILFRAQARDFAGDEGDGVM